MEQACGSQTSGSHLVQNIYSQALNMTSLFKMLNLSSYWWNGVSCDAVCGSASTDVSCLKLKLTRCTNLLFWLCTPAHLMRSALQYRARTTNKKSLSNYYGVHHICVCVFEREWERMGEAELSCSISRVQMCPWWFWLASVFCQES